MTDEPHYVVMYNRDLEPQGGYAVKSWREVCEWLERQRMYVAMGTLSPAPMVTTFQIVFDRKATPL